jgi:hypothetical protein
MFDWHFPIISMIFHKHSYRPLNVKLTTKNGSVDRPVRYENFVIKACAKIGVKITTEK